MSLETGPKEIPGMKARIQHRAKWFFEKKKKQLAVCHCKSKYNPDTCRGISDIPWPIRWASVYAG